MVRVMICQKVCNHISYDDLAQDYILTIVLIGAFYMVGDFESARAKGEKILADLEKST